MDLNNLNRENIGLSIIYIKSNVNEIIKANKKLTYNVKCKIIKNNVIRIKIRLSIFLLCFTDKIRLYSIQN